MNLIKRLLLAIIIIFFSCTKEHNKSIYKGEVVSQPNYCTSGSGFPFVIAYLTTTNHLDSIFTTTLPVPYKFIGQKIEFEMRALNSEDEKMACTDLFSTPKQVVIFHVSKQ